MVCVARSARPHQLLELRIPKVGAGVRICSIVGGLFFMALGIGIQTNGSTPGPSNSSSSPSPVNFMIYDDLNDGQVREQVNVLIHFIDRVIMGSADPGRSSYSSFKEGGVIC
jgi:hypothetical protein